MGAISIQQPFPESLRESRGQGAGPDFPGSSGDRERGKFRPSNTPGLAVVAVTDDDGQPLGRTTDELLAELVLYQKATLVALSLLAEGGSFSVEEVLAVAADT